MEPPLDSATVPPPDTAAVAPPPVSTQPGPAPADLSPTDFASPEFAALYETHNRQVFYLALRLLGDPTLAEDATHDVFLKAWRNLQNFRGDADIRTWLYRITLNHCSNLRSSWHARNVHTQSDDTIIENAAGAAESPFRDVEMSELGRRIQTALDALPEEYRVLLLLIADQELSYDAVAQITHQTADAVRGKLHRARKAFGIAFRKTG